MKKMKHVPLDATTAIITPEGVTVEAVLADPIRRMAALFLDMLVLAVLFYLLFLLAGFVFLSFHINMGRAVLGLLLVVYFILVWFYFFIGEFFCSGQTIGKKVFGIYVLSVDLTPLSFSAALWRNVLRYIDFMPGCFAVGLVFILASPKQQRLGDWMAGSVVVVKEHRLRFARMGFVQSDWVKALNIVPMPPPWQVDYQGRLALIDFARFCALTNAERAAEMSEPFAALLPTLNAQERVARLLSYAAYLEGGK